MTREQIEDGKSLEPNSRDFEAWLRVHGEDLLAAAERALLLEEVLSAARVVVAQDLCTFYDSHDRAVVTALRAAIDRAEGKS